MLHVSNLSYNLLSIGKITKDLNCSVIFTSNCTFHDSITGRMIGHAKEKDGLYLDTNRKTSVLRSQGLVSTSPSKIEQIWICHSRLIHPPFPLLKKVLPSLFENVDWLNFHCEMCLLARHHRVSFPIKNYRYLCPFSLIHSNVWGPSHVSNHSSYQWFLKFIDESIWSTWVYLLKSKFEVSTFPIFDKLISTQFGVKIQIA